MRNTKEIHDLEVRTDDIKLFGGSELDEFNNNIGIEKAKPTTVVGAIPKVIPVKNLEFHGSLEQILKKSIEHLNESSTQINTVFLHDNSVTTDDIKKKLKKLDTFDDVVSYPSSNDPQNCQDGLNKFLQNENVALITHEKYFRGCETRKVAYFCGNGENVRSTTARAVETLVIVQKLENEYGQKRKEDHIFQNSRMTKFLSHPNPFYWVLNHLENWTSKVI